MGKKTREKQQSTRKGTCGRKVAATLCIITGAALAWHAFTQRYQPRPDYRISQGRIEIGSSSDQLYDPVALTEARNIMWQKIPQERPELATTTEIKFESLTRQTFAIPLDSNYNPSPARSLHEQAMQELAVLGFPNGFLLKPVYSLEDIDAKDQQRVTYLFKDTGSAVLIKAQFISPNRAVPIIFRYENSEGGSVDGTVTVTTDKITCTRGDCRVSAEQRRTAGVLSSLFTEPLHYELMPARTSLAQKLLSQGPGFAIAAATVTDEAVVHGVFQDYLREHHVRLGYAVEALAQESADKARRFKYYGVAIIADRCQERGRRAVIDEYLLQPETIWKLLRERIPDYQRDIR